MSRLRHLLVAGETDAAAAVQERDSGTSLRKNGAYGQVAYTIFGRVQPVVRFDAQIFPGKEKDIWQVAPGLNALLAPNVVWKFNYYLTRAFDGATSDPPDEFFTELAFAF